jgi:pimeloyl-ACP methyl ester carboxylesterase
MSSQHVDADCVVIKPGLLIGKAEFGSPGGEPVFYFHGWPGARLEAALGHQAAIDSNLRLIALERPGIGLSSPQPGLRLVDWPDVVEAAADALTLDHYSVLGISGGGPYALACAFRAAPRLRAVGVCCGAPPLCEYVTNRELPAIFRLLMAIERTLPVLLLPGFAVFRAAVGLCPPAVLVRLGDLLLSPNESESLQRKGRSQLMLENLRASLQQGSDGLIRDARRIYYPWGFQPEEVRWPVEFWHGGRDTVIPVDLIRRYAAELPCGKLHLLPDEGHFSLPFDNAGIILARLRELIDD